MRGGLRTDGNGLGPFSDPARIGACEKGGQWQLALSLFQNMSSVKVIPGVISYSAAISACEKSGQWQHALRLFQHMPDAKVSPNVIGYCSATIGACEKGGQWQAQYLVSLDGDIYWSAHCK